MKPRRLVIEGLRSHRGRTEVDFSEASLFAIVGDTGAGKSSILEAIVYALYAAATWTRQPGELISDGMRTMTVEFTFEVDGRAWLVRRSMSRGGYPPPIHLLMAADDPSTRYDSAATVNVEIERLLGLSVDAFCSAVILPQGRFERLLTETPANRTRILKGIFRLERLDEARDLAKALADRYRPLLDNLRLERAALLPDPRAAAAEARSRLKQAEASLTAMTGLLAIVDAQQAEEAEIKRQADATASEADSLMSVRQDLDVQEGERLAALAAALDAELEPLRHQLEIATEAETAALAAVSTGQRARLDAAAVARYREALEQARSRLPQLAARKARLRSVHEAIESDTARLAGAEQSAASLTTAATDAAAKAVAARRAAEIARGELDTARQTLVELGDAATRRTEHEAAMIASTHAAAGTRPVAERLQGVAAAAIDHRDAAQRDFETAMRGEAAATAAQRHAPGDPCPVCARALPKGWRRPAAPLLDMAGSALEQAKAAVAMAERDAREAADEANAAQHRVALAAAQSAELERSFARVVARLESQLGDFAPDIDDDEALNGLVVAAASAASTADASGRAADEAKTAEATAQAAAAEQQESLVRRREELRRGAGEVAADEQGIHEALKILPAPLRLPDRPAPNDLTEPLALLDTLEIENAERDAALAVARSRVRHLERQRQVIEARRRSEADLPLARYRERMARVAAAVERAEASAGTAVRVTLDGAEPSVIESRANAIAGVLSARARALEVRRVKIGAERSGTLSAHGVVSRDEVVERAQEATGDRAVADADRDRAEGQIRQAAHLEKRIGDGGDLVDAVTELARLLADGQFLSYVVETRQRALLGIASTILTEMSGGRYGFSHDFQIVDQTSGQPRSPKTLSGGESFQASLALALGLVELAGRSGGRLSSLFLDEGFGTLDANALDEALEELERRAASGRVIGVITHLRSVADRIENVLLVDKDLGRTQVRWLNGNERERMTSDDLAHITALTG